MRRWLRRGLLRLANSGPFSAVAWMLERVPDRRRNLLRVLTYHRVDHPAASQPLDPDLLSATPEAFARQMRFLAQHCRVVSLAEVLAALQGDEELPPKAVLLTFDDAYRGFSQHAWPILKELGLPVTLFVPTGFPDRPDRVFWWDRLYQRLVAAEDLRYVEASLGRLPLAGAEQRLESFRRLKQYLKSRPHAELTAEIEQIDPSPASHAPNHVLTWQELRQLAREGVTLAPHTRHHPLLNRVSPAEAKGEVLRSLDDLRQEIGPSVPPVLAYPSGGFNQEVEDVVRQAGFQAAFTTCRGINDLTAPGAGLRLRRTNIGIRTGLPLMRVQLLSAARVCNRLIPLEAARGD